jgi:anaerobic selenocysteine-containing dehydrogenase
MEGYDLARGYGPLTLRLGRPAIEPVGEARANADVFGELIDRVGLGEPGDRRGELEELLGVLEDLPADISTGLRECGAATPPFDGRPIQFQTVWPLTPDGKADLFPEQLGRDALYVFQPDPGTSEYPLALISPASERTVSSTLSELPRPEIRLLMHPDDAAARELKEGDAIRIFNALGEVKCNVTIGAWIRQGTVSLPKGLWRRHTANGYTGTALVPDTLTDFGGGACFNDARVQVERIAAYFPPPSN